MESYTIPIERGGTYFFKKRLADENQGSIYIRHGLQGQDERLVDATKLSTDQNTSVQIYDVSKDGKLLVYGTRAGGADEEAVHLLDIGTRKELSDSLPSARYSEVSISPDQQGLYYARLDPTGSARLLSQAGLLGSRRHDFRQELRRRNAWSHGADQRRHDAERSLPADHGGTRSSSEAGGHLREGFAHCRIRR